MDDITPADVKARLERGDDVHLVDVREAEEIAICSLPGAEHIPMLELFTGMQEPEVDPGREIVVFCHHGVRSHEAAHYLRRAGYIKAKSMLGGIDRWATEVDPSMKRY